MGDLFGVVGETFKLFRTTNQTERHDGTRAAVASDAGAFSQDFRQLMPAAVQSCANLPAQTSSFFWPPSAMTSFTFALVMAFGVSRIEGTSRLPCESSVVPVVCAFWPLLRAMAASASAPASSLADL